MVRDGNSRPVPRDRQTPEVLGAMVKADAENGGAGIDHDVIFDDWMSGIALDQLAVIIARKMPGTERDGLIDPHIIADHGGYIGAEPNPPRGTRFVIELPVCLESSLSTTNRASANR